MDKLKIELAGVPAGRKMLVGSAINADSAIAVELDDPRVENICLQKDHQRFRELASLVL